ncbi:CSL zinc finger-domain-containing protein [Aspergillus unguis]
MTRTSTTSDFYEILNLPFPTPGSQSTALSKQQLKLAYHKALLKHHPDKALSAGAGASAVTNERPATSPRTPAESNVYTVDEITTAYKTLSDPSLRAEYDRVLRLDRTRLGKDKNRGAVFHTGLEVVDLEDLDCDESEDGDTWYRGCRCGDERGFLVSESDLEREADHGEIVVGCRGCSLWMKVLFALQDGDEEEHEGR